jgi:hypothetical protein
MPKPKKERGIKAWTTADWKKQYNLLRTLLDSETEEANALSMFVHYKKQSEEYVEFCRKYTLFTPTLAKGKKK